MNSSDSLKEQIETALREKRHIDGLYRRQAQELKKLKHQSIEKEIRIDDLQTMLRQISGINRSPRKAENEHYPSLDVELIRKNLRQIAHIESGKRKREVVSVGGKHICLLDTPLHKLPGLVPELVQCHRSHVVNREKIKGYFKKKDQAHLILTTCEKVPVSRPFRAQFLLDPATGRVVIRKKNVPT